MLLFVNYKHREKYNLQVNPKDDSQYEQEDHKLLRLHYLFLLYHEGFQILQINLIFRTLN